MLMHFKNRRFNFSVDAPPSKSVYHRELIVRFLKGYRDDLSFRDDDSADVRATKSCIKALREASSEGDIILPCNESGSTLRFMIPVAAAFAFCAKLDADRIVFTTAGRLYDRPLDALEGSLADHGIKIQRDDESRSLRLSGTLTPGKFVIDGSVSSQFVSGLLMALIVMPGSTLEVTGTPASVPYIKLTENVISKYKDSSADQSGDFTVEGDWSAGAFLLCLKELINGDIKVGGLDMNSVQGDKAILEFMKLTGCGDIGFDCIDIPDIVPYMAVLAAFKNKETTFNNIGRLRVKESDRVTAIREQLEAFKIKTEETPDTLRIYGCDVNNTEEKVYTLKSYNDHRMVMTAVLLGAASGSDIEIDTIDPIDKSFPAFKRIITEEFS